MELRRLLPDQTTLDLAEAYTGLDFASLAAPDRPWLGCNFIATADGRAQWDGKSGGLGGPADKEIFARLRCSVDAILAGNQTVRVERYGRLVDQSERREARVRQGLEADPVAVLITRTGDLPIEAPLFEDPAQRIIAYGPPTMADPPGEAPVTVVRMDEVEPRAIVADLHDRGIRSVMCEGGPRLFSGLVHAGVVDELFLTISPSLAGGGGAATVTTGMPLEDLQRLRIESIHEHDDFLFMRYRLR